MGRPSARAWSHRVPRCRAWTASLWILVAASTAGQGIGEDLISNAGAEDEEPPSLSLPNVASLTAQGFEDAVSRHVDRTSCVLFHQGTHHETVSSKLQSTINQLEISSQELLGIVRFYTLDCDSWPKTCAAQNALPDRKASFILIIYPPAPGAAEVYSGAFAAPDITQGILRRMAVPKGLVTKLKPDTSLDFLQEGFRPFKLIFFAGSTNLPVLVYELARDPILRIHVDFAYSDSIDEAELEQFDVKNTPCFVIQYGELASTRQFHTLAQEDGSPLHPRRLVAVRKWILEVIQGEDPTSIHEEFPAQQIPLVPALEEIVPAVVGTSGNIRFIVQSSTHELDITVEVPSKAKFTDLKLALARRLNNWDIVKTAKLAYHGKDGFLGYKDAAAIGGVRSAFLVGAPLVESYEVLGYGEQGCPPGHEITSVDECERAILFLAFTPTPKWISNYDGLPKWCSIRETADDKKERMHFNSATTGQGRKDLAPVCKQGPLKERVFAHNSETDVPIDAAAPDTNSQLSIPELTELTRKKLFGTEGYSLIYLQSGPLSEAENDMLLEIKDRFASDLQLQGTTLNWMWMDVQVERKLKAIFDPPILPSAVILKPHQRRPGFAIVKHNEEDEDPQPATEDAIVLLVNKMIGGDARYKIIPDGKLSSKESWAERRGGASGGDSGREEADTTQPLEEDVWTQQDDEDVDADLSQQDETVADDSTRQDKEVDEDSTRQEAEVEDSIQQSASQEEEQAEEEADVVQL